LGKKLEKPEVINNAQVTDASILKRFGYMVWDRDGVKWKGSRCSTRTASRLLTVSWPSGR
jgi:hypothetical protein